MNLNNSFFTRRVNFRSQMSLEAFRLKLTPYIKPEKDTELFEGFQDSSDYLFEGRIRSASFRMRRIKLSQSALVPISFGTIRSTSNGICIQVKIKFKGFDFSYFRLLLLVIFAISMFPFFRNGFDWESFNLPFLVSGYSFAFFLMIFFCWSFIQEARKVKDFFLSLGLEEIRSFKTNPTIDASGDKRFGYKDVDYRYNDHSTI